MTSDRSSADLAQSVVNTGRPASHRGLLQKLFAVWFDAFIYNQIWEDPLVDIEALQIEPSSHILTISSGGCNALNYLLEGPAAVTAIDLNRSHIFLLELKRAAIEHLPLHRDLFEFFGEGRGPNTQALYYRYIRAGLSREARSFWESNSLVGSLLYGDRIGFFDANGCGLYSHARNGYFLRFFQKLAHLYGLHPERILNCSDQADQIREFEKNIAPFFATLPVRFVSKLPITVFGLGIPPQQFDALIADLDEGETIVDLFRERVRRLACEHPIDENYFAWQAFASGYDTESRRAIPEYLKEENFEALKHCVSKLSTVIGSVTDVIRASPPATFDRFVLLDAQDWMNVQQLTELWTAIAEKARPGSRIIFRTAGSASPLKKYVPAEVAAKFSRETELSQRLFHIDRSSIYGGFHVYVMRQGK